MDNLNDLILPICITIATLIALYFEYHINRRLKLSEEDFLAVLDVVRWKEFLDIKSELEQKHNGVLPFADLYSVLGRLCQEGLVDEQDTIVSFCNGSFRDSKVFRKAPALSAEQIFLPNPRHPELVCA